jgi:hypothetical protein
LRDGLKHLAPLKKPAVWFKTFGNSAFKPNFIDLKQGKKVASFFPQEVNKQALFKP